MSRLDTATAGAAVTGTLVLFGLGFGLVSQTLVVAIQNSVNRSDLGIATASANLFRALGGSVGVAVFGAIFASRLGAGRPDPAGVAHALHGVFLVAAPVALAGMAIALMLKEVPLRGGAVAPTKKEGAGNGNPIQPARAAAR
jgi:MFS family permease